jgi:hypothetical protein
MGDTKPFGCKYTRNLLASQIFLQIFFKMDNPCISVYLKPIQGLLCAQNRNRKILIFNKKSF